MASEPCLGTQSAGPVAARRRPWWLLLLLVCLAVGQAAAADKLPPAPTRYFNDYAGIVSAATADRLNTELENLEKESSNQILVAIYPQMETASSIEDYCHRIFATWHVGQKGSDNGAVLFIFVQNHLMHIETNRGLEGPLPDATCEDIIEDQIAPHFKVKDYDAGVTAGVESMIQATKGEYKGSGQTVAERQQRQGDGAANAGRVGGGGLLFLLIVGYIIFSSFRRRGTMFTGVGPIILGGLLGGGGGGFGGGGGGGGFGGGGGGGGGGGFSSGGGGSGGGGGASGGW